MIRGKEEGNSFELALKRQAQSSGLLVHKNPQACKYTWNGRLMAINGHLDFILATPGRMGIFDAKSFKEDKFTYSDIDPRQIDQACIWEDWLIPSGFIVYFRRPDKVVHFTGHWIARHGSGSSFKYNDGLQLGTLTGFNLKELLR